MPINDDKDTTIKGISMYFNWGLALLKHILPTDISPAELSGLKKRDVNNFVQDFLNASTCFISKQYMKDPQLKYISSSRERWFSCVLLGENWGTVVKGIFNKEFDKKLNRANCIIFDFVQNEEGMSIVLKEKIIISKDNYYPFKNQVIDKFGLKIKDYIPEGYDPSEGNLILDRTNLTIICKPETLQSFLQDEKPPFWLNIALDWETVDKIIIRINENGDANPFSIKSILNRIVIYPDCPSDWRDLKSGSKALEVIEDHVGKTICDFFMYLTIHGKGESWYPVLDSAIEGVLKQWNPFLNFVEKTNPDKLDNYIITLLKRYFALPEKLTIREGSEYKYLTKYFFLQSDEELKPNPDFILPASDESLNFILRKIGDPEYINISISLIKKMVQFIKESLSETKDITFLFVDYLEKNLSFVEELNLFYLELIHQMDNQYLGFLEEKTEDKFNKLTQYLYSLLFSEKDNNIRLKIFTFLIYRNMIFDVIPDIYEHGDLDDRYLAASIIQQLKDNKSNIPESILSLAESEIIRAEYMLGKERCDEIKSKFAEIEKSLGDIVKLK